jgi:hypothetical protein
VSRPSHKRNATASAIASLEEAGYGVGDEGDDDRSNKYGNAAWVKAIRRVVFDVRFVSDA